MKNLSIKITLLVILIILNSFIAAQSASNAHKAWQDYQSSKTLIKSTVTITELYQVERLLAQERALAIAIFYGAKKSDAQTDLVKSQNEISTSLSKTLQKIEREDSRYNGAIKKVREDYSKLLTISAAKNSNVKPDLGNHSFQNIFDAYTNLVISIHTLIEKYSEPALLLNASVARQLRFFDIVWGITEYASRDYTVLESLIAENKFPDSETEKLLNSWRGRIEYGWELTHVAASSNNLTKTARPILEEAESHYFLTFSQIQDIFQQDKSKDTPYYPVTVEMWAELAHQAIDSLHEMNQVVLNISLKYVSQIEENAIKAMIFTTLLLLGALLLSLVSLYIIFTRIITPVNSMTETLFKASHGDYCTNLDYESYPQEISKLGRVLQVLQENSQQLTIERDNAKAANIAKSEFLANMSHEIRTPMNVILGLSKLMFSTSLDEKQKKFMDTLFLSAESLLSLINDLLDIAKIETRAFELENIPFNFKSIAEEVVSIMAPKMKEKGLIWENNFSFISGKIYCGDPTRFRQILLNIYSNAVKFTAEGKINLTINGTEASDGYEDLTIEISDTGIGIPEEKIGMIFDKFTQGDSSISREYGGTGLGLAIAQTFITMMGGSISADSTPGKGTTFKIKVRLKLDSVQTAPEELISAQEDSTFQKTGNVLVVDDFEPNLLVARNYLERLGFNYDSATSGFEALDKVQHNRYDAILMDIRMPEMDGYEVTEKIRSFETDNQKRRTRIIAVTAYALSGDREQCLASGMDDYLSKPYSEEMLAAKLNLA